MFKKFLKRIVRSIVLIVLMIFSPILRLWGRLSENVRYGIWKYRLGQLGENTKIYPYVVIHNPECVKIGNNVSIAEFVHISGVAEEWK